MMVLGHRLLTGITYQGAHPSRLDALDYVSWGRWVTLLFQVMPVFFRGLRESASALTVSTRCRSDRPSRSGRHTTSVSPARRYPQAQRKLRPLGQLPRRGVGDKNYIALYMSTYRIS